MGLIRYSRKHIDIFASAMEQSLRAQGIHAGESANGERVLRSSGS
jgi:hypothetical protein